MIVSTGMSWLLGQWGGSPAPSAQWVAIGTSPTIVESTQTQLIHEVVRKELTNVFWDSGSGVIIFETQFGYDEANFIWGEVGLFAGGNSSPDTGTMLARGVVSEDKDSRRTALVLWQLGLTRSNT